MVITFRNGLCVKVLGFYFQNWLLGPDLAKIWAKFGPIWLIEKLVRAGIMSAALWRCPWLSKTCSDSRSRVSKVKNSRDIFTLFSPHSKCPLFKLVWEICWFIGLRASFYPYASNHRPYSVGIFFYMMWRMMNRAQLASERAIKKGILVCSCTLTLG